MTENRTFLHAASSLLAGIALTLPSHAQCELTQLTGAGLGPGDSLGWSMDTSGSRLLVGARFSGPQQEGSAHVFRVNGTQWIEEDRLVASDSGQDHNFGTAVALSSELALVGSPFWANSGSLQGCAYLFERQASNQWIQTEQLIAPNGADGDRFGFAVALDGDFLAVGAPEADGQRGRVYLYALTNLGWTLLQEIQPVDTVAFDRVGFALELREDILLIGAPFAPTSDGANTGAVYAYLRNDQGTATLLDDTFEPLGKLATPGVVGGARTGSAIAFDGSRAAIGSPLAALAGAPSGHLGAVSTHAFDGASFSFETTIPSPCSSIECGFGVALALSPDELIVGTPLEGASGAASLFRWSSDSLRWIPDRDYASPSAQTGDEWGRSVGWSQSGPVVGAPGSPSNGATGRVGLFSSDANSAVYCVAFTDCPCGNEDNSGGCSNTTGAGGHLRVVDCASSSVQEDVLRLRATELPPGQFAILFMGDDMTLQPFAAGQRCVASFGGLGVHRFAPQNGGATGTITVGPGIVAESQGFPISGQILAGQDWNFQCWYRDPTGPCAGQTSNLTNALRVTFLP